MLTFYVSTFRRNALAWVIKESQDIAVKPVLVKVWPQPLEQRIESDLRFTKSRLRTDFMGLMYDKITFSDAFQLLNIGRPSLHQNSRKKATKKSGNKPLQTGKQINERQKSTN